MNEVTTKYLYKPDQEGVWKRAGDLREYLVLRSDDRGLVMQHPENAGEPRPLSEVTFVSLDTGPEWYRVTNDPVNHPKHYTAHPSGVECIQVTEHMGFCLGSAVKCLWRAGEKADELEDLKKAQWYIARRIQQITK